MFSSSSLSSFVKPVKTDCGSIVLLKPLLIQSLWWTNSCYSCSRSYSLHFRPPVDGEHTRNHGLSLPGQGISGAVTPWSAVFIFMRHSNFAYIIITPLIERSKRIAKRSDTKLQIKMLCETSFCLSGLKKALVAEDFLSLVRKGGHIFNDTVQILKYYAFKLTDLTYR